MSPMRRMFAGLIATIARTPTQASTQPNTPAINDSKMLSVSSCLITRIRVAPRAARIAISRRRPLDRTSWRFATFTIAIKRTKETAANITNNTTRTLPTNSSLRGLTVTPQPLFVAGYCSCKFWPIRSISAWACLTESPDPLKRATTLKE